MHFRPLIEKVEALKTELERLKSENQDLHIIVDNQRINLKNKDFELKQLKNQLKVVKLAGQKQPQNQEEVAEMKKKLNQYIREIDECIKLLEL